MAMFTPEQQSDVRIALGLPDSSTVAVVVGGERIVSDAIFSVDRAMREANESVVPFVLRYIDECRKIDDNISKIAESREFESADKLSINAQALKHLEELKDYWGKRLAGALGVKYYRTMFAMTTGEGSRLNGRWST